MQTLPTRDLFQLQTELIDMKVDMAVNQGIDRVVKQISDLKNDIHAEIQELRNEMNTRFSSLDTRVSSVEGRLIAVETKLGMVNTTQNHIRAKTIDYTFKAGWILVGAFMSYVLVQLHTFIK